MKTLLILLALCLLAGCGESNMHDPLIVTGVSLIPEKFCVKSKQYSVRINNAFTVHTDTIYHIGDTIK